METITVAEKNPQNECVLCQNPSLDLCFCDVFYSLKSAMRMFERFGFLQDELIT